MLSAFHLFRSMAEKAQSHAAATALMFIEFPAKSSSSWAEARTQGNKQGKRLLTQNWWGKVKMKNWSQKSRFLSFCKLRRCTGKDWNKSFSTSTGCQSQDHEFGTIWNDLETTQTFQKKISFLNQCPVTYLCLPNSKNSPLGVTQGMCMVNPIRSMDWERFTNPLVLPRTWK